MPETHDCSRENGAELVPILQVLRRHRLQSTRGFPYFCVQAWNTLSDETQATIPPLHLSKLPRSVDIVSVAGVRMV